MIQEICNFPLNVWFLLRLLLYLFVVLFWAFLTIWPEATLLIFLGDFRCPPVTILPYFSQFMTNDHTFFFLPVFGTVYISSRALKLYYVHSNNNAGTPKVVSWHACDIKKVLYWSLKGNCVVLQLQLHVLQTHNRHKIYRKCHYPVTGCCLFDQWTYVLPYFYILRVFTLSVMSLWYCKYLDGAFVTVRKLSCPQHSPF